MLLTTTPSVEGQKITKYCGVVTGEAILGANVFKDLFAGIRDIVGGRSATYEKELQRARDIALKELEERARQFGANAVVGIDLDLRSTRSRQWHAHGLGKRHCSCHRVKVEPADARRGLTPRSSGGRGQLLHLRSGSPAATDLAAACVIASTGTWRRGSRLPRLVGDYLFPVPSPR